MDNSLRLGEKIKKQSLGLASPSNSTILKQKLVQFQQDCEMHKNKSAEYKVIKCKNESLETSLKQVELEQILNQQEAFHKLKMMNRKN